MAKLDAWMRTVSTERVSDGYVVVFAIQWWHPSFWRFIYHRAPGDSTPRRLGQTIRVLWSVATKRQIETE